VAMMTFIAKNVKRSDGKSIVAAMAYRAGDTLTDDKNIVHDYSPRAKKSVASAEIFLPTNAPEWAYDRGKLWRGADSAERKKNAVTGREFVVNLPHELDDKQRRELVSRFAKEIVKRHGCAVDAAIHRPDRRGDKRNHHAHIMLSTRRLDELGFGAKTRELDLSKTTNAKPSALEQCRALWAQYTNEALSAAGIDATIDHRSYRRQGIKRIAGWHLGNWQSEQERQGIRTEGGDHNRKVAIINAVRSATAWEFVGFTRQEQIAQQQAAARRAAEEQRKREQERQAQNAAAEAAAELRRENARREVVARAVEPPKRAHQPLIARAAEEIDPHGMWHGVSRYGEIVAYDVLGNFYIHDKSRAGTKLYMIDARWAQAGGITTDDIGKVLSIEIDKLGNVAVQRRAAPESSAEQELKIERERNNDPNR
jgi:hypothetical protein